MDFKKLPAITQYIVSEFDKDTETSKDSKITVNPFVADVATLYEKFRTAMDYREDDVILRTTIERILKRRLLLGGKAATIAEPLLRELIWARYFPDRSVSESVIDKTRKILELYTKLEEQISLKHKNGKNKLSDWIIHLASAEIAKLLDPNKGKELLAGFMYRLFVNKVTLEEDEETRDVQVFIAIRRTFARDDVAFLRYNLFKQIFGEVNEQNVEKIAEKFFEAKAEIEKQLSYQQRDKIYSYIKKQTTPFFILEEILLNNKGHNKLLVSNQEQFGLSILNTCQQKYKSIREKVKRAIIRGFIFILITKAIFALAIEGTFENLVYGNVIWSTIAINTGIPPVLMVIAGLFIKTPGKENSIKILERINEIVYENSINFAQPLNLKKGGKKIDPILNSLFVLLWILAFFVSFGGIVFILTKLQFNLISQGIFLFFLTIVSFISYRISQTAHMYTVSEERQGLLSLLFDFFFMPIIHLGRDLTENISKINLVLIIFDLLIETPFKGIFAFFEQWFLFLRAQREKLG